MITLRSSNPKFSWLLSKNPATQVDQKKPFLRLYRKGRLIGWYPEPEKADSFKILFLEGSDSSFSDEGKEYLDKNKYCSPLIVQGALSELLSSTVKTKNEELDVAGHTHSVRFMIELTRPILAKRMAEHLNLQMEFIKELPGKVCLVEIFSSKSLYDLLNGLQAWLSVQVATLRGVFIPMETENVMKYARALNAIDAPYYVRHMLVRSSIRSPKVFSASKQALENGKYVLNFGDSQAHRGAAIFNEIRRWDRSGTSTLYDLGCGEGYYIKRLAPLYEQIQASDNDEIMAVLLKKLESWDLLEKVSLLGKTEPGMLKDLENDTDVLVTEVFEHMPKQQASTLLRELCQSQVQRILITLPNKSFNKYYLLEEHEVRHDDHHWEPTFDQARSFIESASKKSPFKLTVATGIGDGVLCNSEDSAEPAVHSTSMFVLTRQ